MRSKSFSLLKYCSGSTVYYKILGYCCFGKLPGIYSTGHRLGDSNGCKFCCRTPRACDQCYMIIIDYLLFS